jgi:MoxR-like ATPase
MWVGRGRSFDSPHRIPFRRFQDLVKIIQPEKTIYGVTRAERCEGLVKLHFVNSQLVVFKIVLAIWTNFKLLLSCSCSDRIRLIKAGGRGLFESVRQLTAGLHSSGYITDPVTINTVYLASALHKPLLLEGIAGAGKTQLAYAVADAARTTVERLQCYPGIDEAKAIGKFDESLQRLCVEMSTKSASPDWEALADELHSRRFFMAGPLLRALEYEKPCVLLIDELDKVDHAFEAMLLEVLSVWQLSIPKLGTAKARSIPFVVLTSNEERRIGDPLRRRSLYLRIEHPTPEREAEIVAIRTPHASQEFHAGMAGLAKALRGWSMEKAPSVSEIIDLAAALKVLGVETVTPEMRDILLPLLAKTEADRRKLLLRDGFASLVYDARQYTTAALRGTVA